MCACVKDEKEDEGVEGSGHAFYLFRFEHENIFSEIPEPPNKGRGEGRDRCGSQTHVVNVVERKKAATRTGRVNNLRIQCKLLVA